MDAALGDFPVHLGLRRLPFFRIKPGILGVDDFRRFHHDGAFPELGADDVAGAKPQLFAELRRQGDRAVGGDFRRGHFSEPMNL
ncbi:MAG: hypothetical protein M5R36_27735 [Deltaproteobacteria bacterium]|nr:hypothetical protein [Deltaproteobacteria bacterium]